MHFYFCDECGARVSELDIRAGKGMRRGHATICSACIEAGKAAAWMRRAPSVAEAPAPAAVSAAVAVLDVDLGEAPAAAAPVGDRGVARQPSDRLQRVGDGFAALMMSDASSDIAARDSTADIDDAAPLTDPEPQVERRASRPSTADPNGHGHASGDTRPVAAGPPSSAPRPTAASGGRTPPRARSQPPPPSTRTPSTAATRRAAQGASASSSGRATTRGSSGRLTPTSSTQRVDPTRRPTSGRQATAARSPTNTRTSTASAATAPSSTRSAAKPGADTEITPTPSRVTPAPTAGTASRRRTAAVASGKATTARQARRPSNKVVLISLATSSLLLIVFVAVLLSRSGKSEPQVIHDEPLVALQQAIDTARRDARTALNSDDLVVVNQAIASIRTMQERFREFQAKAKGWNEAEHGEQLRVMGYYDVQALLRSLNDRRMILEQRAK